MKRAALILVALVAVAGCRRRATPAASPRLNVLFIAVDDLRPQLHVYGDPLVKSPNIDRLVEHGTLFMHAYCQQAQCNPSRSSLLTGRRPDTLGVFDLEEHFRTHAADVVTLPQYFKERGYLTQSIGKVFHLDDSVSWSVPTPPLPPHPSPSTGEGWSWHKLTDAVSWRATDDDKGLVDTRSADAAIDALRRIRGQAFFLAVGFSRPHLPLIVPQKYLDLYPLASVPLARNPQPPRDVPPVAMRKALGDLARYSDIPDEGPLSDDKAREIIRAYDAAVSYIDAQIGRVVDELDALGLAENTIVVLWGDHGFHLGEHGLWCKLTNFEVAARAPLLFRLPGPRRPARRVDALVEFVDIYPTLVDLAGLPPAPGLEGISLVPLFQEPGQVWKRAAFTQTPRGSVMGRSMRTDRYRYTEWAAPGQLPVGIELYDHQVDPDENVNLAPQPESGPLLRTLSEQLHAGWRAALPAGSR